jgi:hypothetical protein
MNHILSALATGAKTYAQLKGLIPNLDFILGKLLRSREIVMYYPPISPVGQYMIPRIEVDLPLVPSKKCQARAKPRRRKKVTKVHKIDKSGRKKCTACKRRVAMSRYLYNGKTNGVCRDCKPEVVQ